MTTSTLWAVELYEGAGTPHTFDFFTFTTEQAADAFAQEVDAGCGNSITGVYPVEVTNATRGLPSSVHGDLLWPYL